MERDAQRRQAWIICLVLAFGTFALYYPVLNHDFVNFDDPVYVVENHEVQGGVTAGSLTWAFTTGHGSNWHPLTWISHMVDYDLYGLKHPGGHHLTNLLFHIADTLLLFVLLRRMTGALWRSAVVAALFAWHPFHVESVAWVSERKDVLSACFGLLALLAYARYVEESKVQGPKSKVAYRFALLFFALGLMSKPMLVTLPFVMLLLDFWPLKRTTGRKSQGDETQTAAPPMTFLQLIREKIPFFLLAAVSSVVTFLVQRAGGAIMAVEKVQISQRIINALVAYVAYLQKTLCPTGLAAFYPLPVHWPLPRVLVAVVLLALISTVAIWQVRARSWLLIGWLWFLGMLVPVIGLVQVGGQAMADRYSYLPSIGIFIVFVWGIAELFGGTGKSIASAGSFAPPMAERMIPTLPISAWFVFAPALVSCLFLARTQLGYWKNSETLFRHDLEVTTGNATAHFNLARALDDAGHSEEAGREFDASLRVNPAAPLALLGMGRHYAKQGDDANALKYYLAALRANPDYGDAHFNLANLLARQGNFDEAVEHYAAALRADPNAADAHNNFGAVLMRLGRWNEALPQFKEALRLRPNYPEAHDQLGTVLLKLGYDGEAGIHFAEAVRLNPDLVHARMKLGLMLAQHGRFDAATANFRAILKLEPKNGEATYNLAAVFAAQNHVDEAAQMFADAAKLQPDNPDPLARLAALLVVQGKIDAAIDTYVEALKLKSDMPEALRGLAWLLATAPKAEQRDGAEAVKLAEQADALTGHKQPGTLSALDAAYAEVGRFDDAIKTAQEAQKQALAQGRPDIADAAAKRIELYRTGKPFHQ